MRETDNLETLLDTLSGPSDKLSFYNGEVTLYYHDGVHAYYTVDSNGTKHLVPGATDVCGIFDKSQPLMAWAVNQMALHSMMNAPTDDVTVNGMLKYFQHLRERAPWDQGVFGYQEDIPLTFTAKEFVDLLYKARSHYRMVVKDAADVGHTAHGWLQQYLNSHIGLVIDPNVVDTYPPWPEDNRAVSCINAALDWMYRHKYRPFFSEKKVYSREYHASGTLDKIGEVTACGDPQCCPFIGTHTELGDFKSSNAIHEEFYLQTAFYQQGHTEEFPDLVIDARRILRLGKEEGEFESRYLSNDRFELDLEGFVGLLAAWNWKKQIWLDSKYQKAVEKAAKDALKPKKKPRKPRKPVIKELIPVESEMDLIPVEDAA
jgi:hypothetical protein